MAMHRLQQVALILALAAPFLAWPLLRWYARRRDWSVEPIRTVLSSLWRLVICIYLVRMFFTEPGLLPLLVVPSVIWLFLYLLASRGRVSMKPLEKWLSAPFGAFLILACITQERGLLHQVAMVGFLTVAIVVSWVEQRYSSETIGTGLSRVRFRIPASMRVNVNSPDFVAPWYIQTLGLHRVKQANPSDRVILKAKEDGNPLILAAPYPTRSYTYPLLFTESLVRCGRS